MRPAIKSFASFVGLLLFDLFTKNWPIYFLDNLTE